LSQVELPDSPAVLGVLSDFFDQLHEAGVVYCHWKSNEHLGAALGGLTDLDLLVERGARQALGEILIRAGFKLFIAAPERGYPGVEDYLTLDPVSGRLIHLHLHYQLTLGEPYLKGYRLPWEHTVLASRRLDPETGVYVSDPNMEFLLLIVRAALKLRLRDILAASVYRRPFANGVMKEYHWLVERIDCKRLLGVAQRLAGDRSAQLLLRLTREPPTTRQLLTFRRAMKPPPRNYRTYRPTEARRRRWMREWQWQRRRFATRLLGAPKAARRTLPQGGIVIALLGSDGAGKSTLVAEITRWLAQKADVIPVYFGSGNGPVSLARRVLRLPIAIYRMGRRSVPATSRPRRRPGSVPGPRSPLKQVFQMLWALSVAREKRQRLSQARRARNLGKVVLCDRFPQCQIQGTTDGPLLGQWLEHPNRFIAALARWEVGIYRAAQASPPDLVLKLHVTPEVASRRRSEPDLEYLAGRAQVIRDLRYPSETTVVEVNADQPMDAVLREVKRAIWQAL
jgi:thymidylate kinase